MQIELNESHFPMLAINLPAVYPRLANQITKIAGCSMCGQPVAVGLPWSWGLVILFLSALPAIICGASAGVTVLERWSGQQEREEGGN